MTATARSLAIILARLWRAAAKRQTGDGAQMRRARFYSALSVQPISAERSEFAPNNLRYSRMRLTEPVTVGAAKAPIAPPATAPIGPPTIAPVPAPAAAPAMRSSVVEQAESRAARQPAKMNLVIVVPMVDVTGQASSRMVNAR
jgi:hypothetical protein